MNTKTREVPVKERRNDASEPCQADPFYRASSTLLSRLAEAVDGHRVGKGVCFVARFWYDAAENGHRLYGPFADCEEAKKFWDDNKLDPEEYGIFGPFYTKEALKRPGGEVEEVVIRFKDKTKKDIVLNGDTHDAVFWKPAAIEKFALPYYMSIGSLEECNDISKRAATADVVAHKIGSIDVVLNAPQVVEADENGSAKDFLEAVGVLKADEDGDAEDVPEVDSTKQIGLYGLTARPNRRVRAKLLSGAIDGER